MKTKNFMLKLFIIVGFLTVQNTLAQQNIGEFNRNEIKIQIDLNETDKVLNSEYYDMTRASREKDFTVTDMNQHIDKLKQFIRKIEERLQQCQNALSNLSEKSGEKPTNMEYKSWTEDGIKSYKSLIETQKSRIERAENDIKRRKSSEQTKKK